MPTKILKKNLKKITLIVSCFLFIFTAHLLAANKVANEEQFDALGHAQQARMYRSEGFQFQESGDLASALKLYQKAVEIDPAYAVVQNDLGVLYEAQGDTDRAEESYLKAIKADPDYAGAYTNLALLYENKRELEKAAYFWRKRVELGNPDDFWTWKAGQRLEDINLTLYGRRIEDIPAKDVNALIKDVISKKSTAQKPQKTKPESYEKSYSAEMQQALEDAKKLNPKKKDTK
ncbi:MAG: tetratricopeptide repeat protein [Candidatus Omnitrophica bacterium]|nr:tetratricopeptide repeat protein [Candidatus Omnitrophota bacterium]